jgi:hypothetical protein
MKKLLILVIAAVLFGCASTDNKSPEVKSNKVKATSSVKKAEKILAPTSSTAIIRSIKAKHIFDQTTVISTLEKAFDESGKVVYETPLITWNGPKPVISLPAGNYEVLVGCWANGGNVYNYHRIKAHIENEKDYTFFCLQQTGKVFLGLNGVVGLYAFYSETPQLEVNQKKYQAEIDSISKK